MEFITVQRSARFCFQIIVICILFVSSVAQNKEQARKDEAQKPIVPCKVEKPKGTSAPLDVKINLFVTDSTGKPVTDLKQEDIKIFEDDAPQTVTSFIKHKGVNNYGIVIDSSASMRSLIGKLIQAGQIIVRNKNERDEVFVISFVSSNKIFLLQDWTTDADLLQRKMDEIYIEGGRTALVDGVYVATEKIVERQKASKESRRYVLVLLSDGSERDSSYSEKELFNYLRGTDIQIFSLGFIKDIAGGERQKSIRFLTRLAHETGGNVIFLVEKDYGKIKAELENALKSLVYELRANYIVNYNSTNALRDGTTRKIKVEIAKGSEKENYFVFARDSYFAPCN